MTRREELLRKAREHPHQLVDEILCLESKVERLSAQLERRNAQLAQNSNNSHKPPSSDGLAKVPVHASLRTKTGRKPGGQPGHPGRTLQPVARPDHRKIHVLEKCSCGQCAGISLRNQPVVDYECRQVFDLPPMRLVVTEHQAEIKRCPVSGRLVKAAFPDGVEAPAQYGPNFRGLMVYFYNQQILPFDRLKHVCQDIFGQPLSLGTLTVANARAYEALQPVEFRIAQGLVRAPIVHLDESGVRVDGSLHWLHVASTTALTLYGIHNRRGVEAMEALGVLPQCRRWLMHDHWKPYFRFDAFHALCNQHLLRELKFLHQEEHQVWALKLAEFLLQQNTELQANASLGEKQFQRVHAQYRKIVRKGRLLHPRLPPGQGRTRQTKAANLLDRLEDYDLSVLAFLLDPCVPFTNNQAEQDIRMIKVKQKISGGFRTLQGSRVFARIRSYLSTCRKQGINLWEASQKAVMGQPFMPAIPAINSG
jgi:transposase